MPMYPFGFGDGSIATIEEQLRVEAQKHLDEMVAEVTASGAKARALMRRGHVLDELLHIAAEEKVDLIVMGTHGYTGMRHALLGSTAEKVIRKAQCPVMVVPIPG